MDEVVEQVAARLRGGFAEPLFAWRDQHIGEREGTIPRVATHTFAPLPSSRKRPLHAATDEQLVDWRALLLTLFRRYAGELLVEGKLLNREEIEVHRFVRSGQRTVVVVDRAVIGRFVVRCRDAPTARIGAVVVARGVSPHPRIVGETAPAVAYCEDTLASLCDVAGEQDLSRMTCVLGFEVAHFMGATSGHRRGRHSDRYASDDDDSDDDCCANAVIMKHSTFSDLRGVRRLMEANHLSPMQWTSLLTSQHGVTDSSMGEEDAWSYVALGTAQKKVWARERMVRGDALRGKGRLKEGLVEYDSALRLDETHGEVLLRRGHVLIELRRYEDAIRDLEKLCQLEPTNESAIEGLLRAKSKLSHSKHVVAASFQRRSRSASRNRDTRTNTAVHRDVAAHVEEQQDRPETTDGLVSTLEKDRLRRLLEQDARNRKQLRKKAGQYRSDSSISSSDDSDSSDSDSTEKRRKRSRDKKAKKSKTSKSTSSRKKRHKRKSHHRRAENRHSDRSSISSNDSYRHSRRHKKSRRSRSRSRVRSNGSSSAAPPEHEPSMLHPILARKPHRLWN